MIKDTEIYKAYLLGYDQTDANDDDRITYSDRVTQHSYETGIIDCILGFDKQNKEVLIKYIIDKINKK